MEDKVLVIPSISNSKNTLYSVCDGHGGGEASNFVSDKMQFELEKVLEEESGWEVSKSKGKTETFSFKKALDLTYKKLDTDFCIIAKHKGLSDGTTVVSAVVNKKSITVANTGDSRALLVKNNWSTEPLSIDHKPNNVDERERITKLGGTVVFWGVWRVQGVLAVSRAIGDVLLKPYVIPDPDIVQHNIKAEDSFLVLAT